MNTYLKDRKAAACKASSIPSRTNSYIVKAIFDEIMVPGQGNVSNRSSPSPVSDEDSLYSSAEGVASVFIYQDYAKTQPVMDNQHTDTLIWDQKLPPKLNVILSDPETQHIISWMPHGRSWRIHEPQIFEQQVMPKYFKHTKWNSFIRLVNAWGFRRMAKGSDRGAYYHELFLRGMTHLHEKMHRLTGKETKSYSDPELEPNFYCTRNFKPLVSTIESGQSHKPKPLQSPPTAMPLTSNSSLRNGIGISGWQGVHQDPTFSGVSFSDELINRCLQQKHFLAQEQYDRHLSILQGSASLMAIQSRQASLTAAREELEYQLEIIRAQERRLQRVVTTLLGTTVGCPDTVQDKNTQPLNAQRAFSDLKSQTMGRGLGGFGF